MSFLRLTPLVLLIFLLPVATHAARLFSSGCEMQSDAPALIISGKEFVAGAVGTNIQDARIDTSIKHSGLSSCHVASTTDISVNLGMPIVNDSTATAATTTIRTYLYIATAPTEHAGIVNFANAGVDGSVASLVLNTDLSLTVDDTNGVGLGTTTALTTNTWYRVEVAHKASASWEVDVDGVKKISGGTHSGGSADTAAIGLCADSIRCGSGAKAQADLYFDDIAVNDDTGSAQTSFPGAGSIVYMHPDSAGDNTGCGAGDYTSVDETTPDAGSTICTLTTDLGGDLFDVNTQSSSAAGIGSTDAVTLVQVGVNDSPAISAQESWNARIKSASGGTTTSGSTTTHNDSYRTNGQPTISAVGVYTLTSYTDPTTAVAWTPTGTNSLDNMQIGAASVDGNPDINLSTLWALVEFIPAAVSASPDTGPTYSQIRGTTLIRGGTTIIK